MENEYLTIVERTEGFFIIDFEYVLEDLKTTANIFGPFKEKAGAEKFMKQFLEHGYSGEGILFLGSDE